jgi:energy-converting hydrogenase A subunit M
MDDSGKEKTSICMIKQDNSIDYLDMLPIKVLEIITSLLDMSSIKLLHSIHESQKVARALSRTVKKYHSDLLVLLSTITVNKQSCT